MASILFGRTSLWSRSSSSNAHGSSIQEPPVAAINFTSRRLRRRHITSATLHTEQSKAFAAVSFLETYVAFHLLYFSFLIQ